MINNNKFELIFLTLTELYDFVIWECRFIITDDYYSQAMSVCNVSPNEIVDNFDSSLHECICFNPL